MIAAATTRSRGQLRPLALAYGLLWACTAAGVGLAALGGVELTTGTPRDALPARPNVAVNLVAHNTLVAIWPLVLVALGWAAIPIARTLADTAIASHLLGHGLLVGSALGSHPDTWRFLPHLPVEWLALAAPAGAWLAARTAGHVALMRTLLLTAALLIAAACMETYAVPV